MYPTLEFLLFSTSRTKSYVFLWLATLRSTHNQDFINKNGRIRVSITGKWGRERTPIHTLESKNDFHFFYTVNDVKFVADQSLDKFHLDLGWAEANFRPGIANLPPPPKKKMARKRNAQAKVTISTVWWGRRTWSPDPPSRAIEQKTTIRLFEPRVPVEGNCTDRWPVRTS